MGWGGGGGLTLVIPNVGQWVEVGGQFDAAAVLSPANGPLN